MDLSGLSGTKPDTGMVLGILLPQSQQRNTKNSSLWTLVALVGQNLIGNGSGNSSPTKPTKKNQEFLFVDLSGLSGTKPDTGTVLGILLPQSQQRNTKNFLFVDLSGLSGTKPDTGMILGILLPQSQQRNAKNSSLWTLVALVG